MTMDDDDLDARIWSQFVRPHGTQTRSIRFSSKKNLTHSQLLAQKENESTNYGSSNQNEMPLNSINMSFKFEEKEELEGIRLSMVQQKSFDITKAELDQSSLMGSLDS